jgi:hypothetical protein
LRGPYTFDTLCRLLTGLYETPLEVMYDEHRTNSVLHSALSQLYLPSAAVGLSLPFIFAACFGINCREEREALAVVAWSEILLNAIRIHTERPAVCEREPFFLRVSERRGAFYIRPFKSPLGGRRYAPYTMYHRALGTRTLADNEVALWRTFNKLGAAFSTPLTSKDSSIPAKISGLQAMAWMIAELCPFLRNAGNWNVFHSRMRETCTSVRQCLSADFYDHRMGDTVRTLQMFVRPEECSGLLSWFV